MNQAIGRGQGAITSLRCHSLFPRPVYKVTGGWQSPARCDLEQPSLAARSSRTFTHVPSSLAASGRFCSVSPSHRTRIPGVSHPTKRTCLRPHRSQRTLKTNLPRHAEVAAMVMTVRHSALSRHLHSGKGVRAFPRTRTGGRRGPPGGQGCFLGVVLRGSPSEGD